MAQQQRNPIPGSQPISKQQPTNSMDSYQTASSTIPGEHRCFSKVGRCGKCCIWCSICSAVIAAILVPILICIVAPDVAQIILDQTEISLPNITQGACTSPSHAYLVNTALLKVPGIVIVPATLNSYTQEVWTTVCGDGDDQQGGWACGDNATEALVGKYLAPAMSVSGGANTRTFAVGMNVNSSTIVLNGVILPTFFYHHKVPFILKAKDMSISLLGLTIGGLHMNKEVTCTSVATLPGANLPNSACHPKDATHAPDSTGQFYEFSCVAGRRNLTMAEAATVQTTFMVSV